MANPDKTNRFQQVDDKALDEARALLANARHAALATLNPETGAPQATRVGLTLAEDSTPLIFVSMLAGHTPALLADPRCSLLVGEPGKGDPLARPRIMLDCEAEKLARDDAAFAPALKAYLAAHPKAELYAALPDFLFFRLQPKSVLYNAGFGRAYRMTGTELLG